MKCCKLLLLMLSLAFATQADELQTVSPGDWQISVAVGYGVLENPRAKTEDITTWVLPSWYYYGDDFYAENFTLGYSLFESDWLSLDIQGQLNEDGIFYEYDGIGKLLVADVLGFTPVRDTVRPGAKFKPESIKRKLSYMGGPSATWYTPAFDMTTALMYDVTGVHNGYEWQLSLKKAFAWSWGAAGIEAGGVYKSEELVTYYYGIRPKEFAGRVPRGGRMDASSNWYVKAVFNVPLTDSLTLVATAKHTWLGSEIRNSILIDQDDYFAGFIGISYGF
ncbi:MipA/OmpV family protein [Shewanella cyperi]|uniref:MipA/OmpV family protein n=1 Tax=Shewanella cyperi TaxID=2814292 RepID=UPI001A944EFC|nr:MipA/OmpV family protein [Shewanella cyperi]QSX41357.1 MipA/OmpV family protein [Shewanella cyperi]